MSLRDFKVECIKSCGKFCIELIVSHQEKHVWLLRMETTKEVKWKCGGCKIKGYCADILGTKKSLKNSMVPVDMVVVRPWLPDFA